MSKKLLHKVLPVIFFICISYVVYTELISGLREIKGEFDRNQTRMDKAAIIKLQNEEDEDLDEELIAQTQKHLHEYEKKLTIGGWRVIDREESYNNELQYYSRDNVSMAEDVIEITSRKESKGNKAYTSGLLESNIAYKYGYYEFTIDTSEGKGLFPAIWLLPSEGYEFLEVDIFEMIGSEPYTFYGVIHYDENGEKASDYFEHKVNKKDQYTVALEWKPEALTWYIDHEIVHISTKGVPQEYMYLIINQAVGGDWPGDPDDSIFPSRFKILNSKILPLYKKGRS